MARVRNVKPINPIPGSNTKPIVVSHFIPPKFSIKYKVEIVTDSETIDVTEIIYEGEFSDGVTESIGDFTFRLVDPSKTVSNKVSAFDSVNIYLDYGSEVTTLKFSGKIERKSNVDNIWFDISGRSIAMITTGVNVTYSSNGDKSRKQVLIDIIEKYFDDTIDTSGISNDSILVNVNYSEIPFWTIVEGLCSASGYDAYIGTDLVFNYFPKNIRENDTEVVSENVNLISVEDFAEDSQEIITQVRVYGKSTSDIPIISSSISDTTNTKGIIKNVKIDNPDIVTPSQAHDFAKTKFESNKDAPTVGTVVSLMLPTILPGEAIRIVSPANGIPPSYYDIVSYRHKFSSDNSPQTILGIKKSSLNTSNLFKRLFQAQLTSSDNYNPGDMDATIIYDYNVNVGEKLFNDGTFDNTEVDLDTSSGTGVLKVVTGETGSWTSKSVTTDRIISGLYLRHKSSNVSGTKFFVSVDDGLSFSEVTSDIDKIVLDGTQTSVILRIDIKSSKTEISSVGIYYK